MNNYNLHIKNPMDFGTIKQKSSAYNYGTPYDIHEDILLIFSNCMYYNEPNSDFHKAADSMQKFY